MINIEWRLRAVTRYVLTRAEQEHPSEDLGGMARGTLVQPSGEFESLALGMKVGHAMAQADSFKFADRAGDVNVTFDSVNVPAPKVRAKMYVTHKQAFRDASWPQDRDGGNVSLGAVYESLDGVDGNAAIENHIFGKATPSAMVTMQIANPNAFDRFTPGQKFYVDFIPVPQEGELMASEDVE